MRLGWMPSSRRQAALEVSVGLSVNVRSLDCDRPLSSRWHQTRSIRCPMFWREPPTQVKVRFVYLRTGLCFKPSGCREFVRCH